MYLFLHLLFGTRIKTIRETALDDKNHYHLHCMTLTLSLGLQQFMPLNLLLLHPTEGNTSILRLLFIMQCIQEINRLVK